MPALEKSAVKVRDMSYIGWNKQLIRKEVELILSSQGSSLNPITAECLGFTKISESSIFSSEDDIFNTCPSYEGTQLLFLNIAGNQEDGYTQTSEDQTGTFRGVVIGLP